VSLAKWQPPLDGIRAVYHRAPPTAGPFANLATPEVVRSTELRSAHSTLRSIPSSPAPRSAIGPLVEQMYVVSAPENYNYRPQSATTMPHSLVLCGYTARSHESICKENVDTVNRLVLGSICEEVAATTFHPATARHKLHSDWLRHAKPMCILCSSHSFSRGAPASQAGDRGRRVAASPFRSTLGRSKRSSVATIDGVVHSLRELRNDSR
jgi:hypothetical protein